MPILRFVGLYLIIGLLLSAYNNAFCDDTGTTSSEEQEFKQDLKLVNDRDYSHTRDLDTYEKFADGIVQKWQGRNKEYYARLMVGICGPLSSGNFKERRQYKLARYYALSALEEPDSISLFTELDLTGNLRTDVFGPGAVTGNELVVRRAKDTVVRLHAWRRLLQAINPDWDSTETLYINGIPPRNTGIPPGADPSAIKDSVLRAEYEEAIRINNQRIEEYGKQYKYRQYLKRHQQYYENSIIHLYSYPPFAIEELKKMLNSWLPDQEAKTRIIEAVEKNIWKWKKREN